jgi:integrase/recombinase XerC
MPSDSRYPQDRDRTDGDPSGRGWTADRDAAAEPPSRDTARRVRVVYRTARRGSGVGPTPELRPARTGDARRDQTAQRARQDDGPVVDRSNERAALAVCPTSLWLSSLRAAGRSPRTIQSYEAAVTMLREWRSQSAPDSGLETLTRLEAMAFVKHLQERYQPGGVALRVRSLRAGWSWMLQEELVESNVFTRMKISVPKEAKVTADDEQIDRMLDRAKRSGPNARRDVALLTLLVETGCRRGEIASLAYADVNLADGTVRFPVPKSMVRTVPLTDRAVVAMHRWARQRGVGSGSLWSVGDPYSLVRMVVQRHSKGTLTPHSMRRAFAVRYLSRGGSETSLMRIAGWSSLEMVRTYVRARADVIAADEFKRVMG